MSGPAPHNQQPTRREEAPSLTSPDVAFGQNSPSGLAISKPTPLPLRGKPERETAPRHGTRPLPNSPSRQLGSPVWRHPLVSTQILAEILRCSPSKPPASSSLC